MEEIFETGTNYPKFLKWIIYLFKKMFCVLTIRNENICVLPYKRLHSKTLIKIITKTISKISINVVLSNYLNELEPLKMHLQEKNINIYEGNILSKYLLYNFVEYISKQKNEENYSQEIFILANNLTKIDETNIIYFSRNLKRINIVTKNINKFNKLEEKLEELGMGVTITNNRRKSLLKAKIIINLDFDEDMLNSFNINQHAIIIQAGKKVNIKSKLFNGINILDYQIIYDSEYIDLSNEEYKKFDKKILYESIIDNKKYEDVINMIKRDNVRIVNLIGKNGIIHKQEYIKN